MCFHVFSLKSCSIHYSGYLSSELLLLFQEPLGRPRGYYGDSRLLNSLSGLKPSTQHWQHWTSHVVESVGRLYKHINYLVLFRPCVFCEYWIRRLTLSLLSVLLARKLQNTGKWWKKAMTRYIINDYTGITVWYLCASNTCLTLHTDCTAFLIS